MSKDNFDPPDNDDIFGFGKIDIEELNKFNIDFDEESLRDYNNYFIALKAFEDLIDNGLTPMESFGVILGMVANMFKKYGWSRQDYIDFLSMIQDTDWPDDPPKKPKLTLIKK